MACAPLMTSAWTMQRVRSCTQGLLLSALDYARDWQREKQSREDQEILIESLNNQQEARQKVLETRIALLEELSVRIDGRFSQTEIMLICIVTLLVLLALLVGAWMGSCIHQRNARKRRQRARAAEHQSKFQVREFLHNYGLDGLRALVERTKQTPAGILSHVIPRRWLSTLTDAPSQPTTPASSVASSQSD